MKVTVLCDKSGNIQSVAILNPVPVGHLRVEIEGGGATHELDIDANVIEPEALLGKKGLEAQKGAYAKLAQILPQR